MLINLTDNNKNSPYQCKHDEVKDLFPIANKKISDLCKENENLLIYPYSIDTFDDKIGSSTIFTIQNTHDAETVNIVTSNIMGFIGIGNIQVKIQSRFDKGRDDFFLHYMLQKVLSFNLFDLSHNTAEDDIFDFLMFMFPTYLKNALRQGLYREYKHFKHNNSNVKGIIDVARHITKNVPFVGNIAYNTREYTYDNNVMELVRHTIEFMKTKQYGKMILHCDEDTVSNVKSIVENTPLYNKNNRNQIINNNLRLKSHPYYTEYRPLQILCLQILRMEEIKYGDVEDEICGILFDGAWLWEEYLNTIICPFGFIHPENKIRKGGFCLFKDKLEDGSYYQSGERFPDFYMKDIVIDAKYKRLQKCERVSQVDRDDIHQMITYMTHLHAHNGVFAFPDNSKKKLNISSHLATNDATISIMGLEISKIESHYDEFCKEMQKNEHEFCNRIKNLIDNHAETINTI